MTEQKQGSSRIPLLDILKEATDRMVFLIDPRDLMPDGKPAPPLMTPMEAARYLRMEGTPKQKQDSLGAYIEAGRLKVTLIQRRRYYTLEALKELVDSQTRRHGEAG